jgi:hypothetical protein
MVILLEMFFFAPQLSNAGRASKKLFLRSHTSVILLYGEAEWSGRWESLMLTRGFA